MHAATVAAEPFIIFIHPMKGKRSQFMMKLSTAYMEENYTDRELLLNIHPSGFVFFCFSEDFPSQDFD